MKLYAHQQRFIDRNPNKALLVWETGTGKTYAACAWLEKRKGDKALVICPKSIVAKWGKDLAMWNLKDIDVTTTDQIKKKDISKYKAIVVDEAHNFSSPLFDKSRSQRASVLYNHVRANPKCHILLLTATPVRSTPWNIHTLACYMSIFWDIKKFRDSFFYFTNMFGRFHYEKKTNWQKAIRPYVEEVADIVLMSDCVDVPVQHEQVIRIPWPKASENALRREYKSPSGEWHERHRAEQGGHKYKVMEDIVMGYRKVIIVCHYLSQIEDYKKQLEKNRLVYVLTGTTKDQDKVVREAREADDCVFIIQASMGSGFDAGEFSVVIFASLSFRYIDMVQMKGRVKRINNLHENTFIYLLGGKCDNAVYEAIKAGHDFDPISYLARTS